MTVVKAKSFSNGESPARRLAATGLAILVAAVLDILFASPASAGPGDRPGAGSASETSALADQVAPACGGTAARMMCYFYNSNYGGAQAGFYYSEPHLKSPVRWVFGSGAGSGQKVENGAGSGHNRDTLCKVTIYDGFNYTGDSLPLDRGQSHPTLGDLHKNNSSHQFHSCI